MKRILPVALIAGLLSGCNEASTIAVIGSADGPTAIYTAGKIAPHLVLYGGIAALVVLVGAGILLYRLSKKRK